MDLSLTSQGSWRQVCDVGVKSVTGPRQVCKKVSDRLATSHVISCHCNVNWTYTNILSPVFASTNPHYAYINCHIHHMEKNVLIF